jgi:hypothetical protein
MTSVGFGEGGTAADVAAAVLAVDFLEVAFLAIAVSLVWFKQREGYRKSPA